MKKEFSTKDYNRISLIFTILIANDLINYLVGQVFDIGGMVVSLSILGVAVVYCYKTMVKIKIPATALVLIIIVMVYYLFTRQMAVTTLFGRHFMFYFIASSVLGMYQCDTEKFLRYMTYAVILIIPFYNDIFVEMTSTRYNTNISMGLSYAMFPILIAPIVHFIFYRKQANMLLYILYAIAAFFLINLVFKGNRGIVLSLLVLAALVFVSGFDFHRKKGVNIVKVIIVLIATVILVICFYDIMEWLNKIFDQRDIEANFLDKILKLENEGDVTNGRSYIFNYTMREISNAPFMGHGLSTIFYNSGYRIVYPHNVFLQLLYDGGLILFIPVVFALIQSFYYAFMGENRSEAVFTLFLITVCMPRVMVSADIWKSEALWLLVMHSLKFYVVRKKKVKVMNQRDVIVKMGTLGNIEAVPENTADENSEQAGVVYD